MTFTSPTFLIFFIFFILVGSFCSFTGRHFKSWLLISSFVFYCLNGLYDALFLFADLLVVFLISRNVQFIKRKHVFNVIIFCRFAFFLIFKVLKADNKNHWLPVGYSFYFLTSTAYLVDLSRQKFDKLNAQTFVASAIYFPNIISGPITKISQIGEQLNSNNRSYSIENLFSGLLMIALGLFKKAIADLLTNVIGGNQVADHYAPATMAWIKMVAFAARFYADFSGYSDIAIGISHMVGIRISENFRTPFLATSVSDFWRRWHMSFNKWLKEYIFDYVCFGDYLNFTERLPHSKAIRFLIRNRLYIGIFCATLFAGVWHGFTLPFIGWGLYIGFFLALETLFGEWTLGGLFVKRCVTFFIILHSFLFFRFKDLFLLKREIVRLYTFGDFKDLSVCAMYFLVTAFALVLPHSIDWFLARREYFARSPALALLCALVFLSIHYFMIGFYGVNFVYARF